MDEVGSYYSLTDDSPAYLAALALHPAFRWSTVESQWADHPNWLTRGKAAVQKLWDEYRASPVEEDSVPLSQPATATKKYAEWVARAEPGDCLVDDPIQYWLLRRRQYPRLSQMAIDVISVPAMSSEPGRIFSLTGQMPLLQRGIAINCP